MEILTRQEMQSKYHKIIGNNLRYTSDTGEGENIRETIGNH